MEVSFCVPFIVELFCIMVPLPTCWVGGPCSPPWTRASTLCRWSADLVTVIPRFACPPVCVSTSLAATPRQGSASRACSSTRRLCRGPTGCPPVRTAGIPKCGPVPRIRWIIWCLWTGGGGIRCGATPTSGARTFLRRASPSRPPRTPTAASSRSSMRKIARECARWPAGLAPYRMIVPRHACRAVWRRIATVLWGSWGRERNAGVAAASHRLSVIINFSLINITPHTRRQRWHLRCFKLIAVRWWRRIINLRWWPKFSLAWRFLPRPAPSVAPVCCFPGQSIWGFRVWWYWVARISVLCGGWGRARWRKKPRLVVGPRWARLTPSSLEDLGPLVFKPIIGSPLRLYHSINNLINWK